MTAALLRYRIAAYVVGVLLLLFCVQLVAKYGFDHDEFAWIALVHGWVYFLYLILAFDLYRRAKWPTSLLAKVLVAGMVPGMAFVIERSVVARVQAAAAPRDAGVPQT